MKPQKCTDKEIRQLEQQGCSATDWTAVRVSPDESLTRIRNVVFIGEVTVGTLSGTVPAGGTTLPCGLYNATISDCHIASGARIAGIRTILSGYDIEEGVCIQDVGTMTAEGGGAFGNGIEIDVVNEAGGRGTTIHNRLTAQTAFLNAMHRHDSSFIQALQRLTADDCAARRPVRGVVARGAHIIGAASIRNVVVGPFARIEGIALLENGTVNSCEEHPTVIGHGVQAREFVISEGARVESGSLLDKVFVGQGVKMGKQFSAENSLFFANAEAFHGEAASVFAGPYTVTHHKSTLLIAGLFSFYNAGSGTNQSNHMYKLGPVHQGVFERGCKTGSFSYVLYESHVGAFSVVIGKHFTNIHTPNFPFSYISEKGGESTIVPAMNLFSVGTARDGEKWPTRDGRKAPDKRDLIIFDIFSPYTVERMRRGRDELLALHEATPKDRATVNVGGLQMTRVLLKKGAKYYSAAITRYLIGTIIDRLAAALRSSHSWSTATAGTKPSASLRDASDWTDVCGLLSPTELVADLEHQIRDGRISSYDQILSALRRMHGDYREYEWQYVVEVFEKEYGYRLSSVPKEQFLKALEEWKKAALSIQSSVLEDARKEFGPYARIGYGSNLDEAGVQEDFRAVRGTVEGNSVVKKLAAESESITRKYDDMVQLIDSALE